VHRNLGRRALGIVSGRETKGQNRHLPRPMRVIPSKVVLLVVAPLRRDCCQTCCRDSGLWLTHRDNPEYRPSA
jgi:hypothetical protein